VDIFHTLWRDFHTFPHTAGFRARMSTADKQRFSLFYPNGTPLGLPSGRTADETPIQTE
jgi:hypothetical protein